MKEMEIINKIKDAEAQTALIIKRAQEESSRMILDAKLKAKEILASREAEADARAGAIAQDSQKSLVDIANSQKAALENKKEELEKIANENLNGAVQFVIKEFYKRWQRPNLKK
jgi:vacuolar-type H+-ATPase subunit H